MGAGIIESPTLESAATQESATVLHAPEVKVCQTQTLILLSIMEPNLTEDDVNVSIETDNITIEIAKTDVVNPILTGKLYGTVDKARCRVRIKNDCVVIKLRKSEDGRWKSILNEEGYCEYHAKAVPAPETRVRPLRTMLDKVREPIEPREEPATAKLGTTLQDISAEAKGEEKYYVAEMSIQPSESKVMGVMENMKLFHNMMLGQMGLQSQQTKDDEELEDLEIKGPLVKHRPDPVVT